MAELTVTEAQELLRTDNKSHKNRRFQEVILALSEHGVEKGFVVKAFSESGIDFTEETLSEMLLSPEAVRVLSEQFKIKTLYSMNRALNVLIEGLSLPFAGLRMSAANSIISLGVQMSRSQMEREKINNIEDLVKAIKSSKE